MFFFHFLLLLCYFSFFCLFSYENFFFFFRDAPSRQNHFYLSYFCEMKKFIAFWWNFQEKNSFESNHGKISTENIFKIQKEEIRTKIKKSKRRWLFSFSCTCNSTRLMLDEKEVQWSIRWESSEQQQNIGRIYTHIFVSSSF
jgi:hypothetical protein